MTDPTPVWTPPPRTDRYDFTQGAHGGPTDPRCRHCLAEPPRYWHDRWCISAGAEAIAAGTAWPEAIRARPLDWPGFPDPCAIDGRRCDRGPCTDRCDSPAAHVYRTTSGEPYRDFLDWDDPDSPVAHARRQLHPGAPEAIAAAVRALAGLAWTWARTWPARRRARAMERWAAELDDDQRRDR